MYPEIPVLSFISAVFTLVPLIWYLRARNIAAMAIGIWLSVTNLTFGVDALVWAETIDIKAAVWCDISTVVITGSRIALPAACLSICIHLERIASFCQMSAPKAKPRRILFECLMCFALPVVYIALHLIVQPRRFDLFYGFGCRPATHPTVATIFLVTIPPLLLTGATIVCAGLAWRHFLVHGVQFYGRRGSISSLTRSLYLRLVGMAISEAMFSAVLIAIDIWDVLSAGLAPIRNMSRHLSDVRIWGPEMVTGKVRTVLEIEWSVTVLQSVVFFALFACRMEVVFQGLQLFRSFLRFFPRSSPPVTSGQEVSERSFASASVPSLPITVVDLTFVPSASTLPYDDSIHKSVPPSVIGPAEDTVGVESGPLESPTRASAIASSHNSLESGFDPGKLVFSPDAWPRTPTVIPSRLSRRSLSLGSDARVRSCAADFWTKMPGCGVEKRQGICVTAVVREMESC